MTKLFSKVFPTSIYTTSKTGMHYQKFSVCFAHQLQKIHENRIRNLVAIMKLEFQQLKIRKKTERSLSKYLFIPGNSPLTLLLKFLPILLFRVMLKRGVIFLALGAVHMSQPACLFLSSYVIFIVCLFFFFAFIPISNY